MRSIMPPGYTRNAERKRLENELRQARAGELAAADEKQRASIEKEIHAEIDRRLGKCVSRGFFLGRVLW
jgi:hypothetical protein